MAAKPPCSPRHFSNSSKELVPRHVCNTKALGFSRSVCRFEAWPLVAQVGELAEDDQACAAGVAAGLVLDANDVSGVVVHLVLVVVC